MKKRKKVLTASSLFIWTKRIIHIIPHAITKLGKAMESEQHYGIIGIFGRPNAGKSTFLNAVVGQKLAAVSRKAHTTRHQISGIYMDGLFQILFLDTPGSVEFKKTNSLQKKMIHEIRESESDLDLVLYFVDCQKGVKGVFLPHLHRLIQLHKNKVRIVLTKVCLLYTSPSPRDKRQSRMPSSA